MRSIVRICRIFLLLLVVTLSSLLRAQNPQVIVVSGTSTIAHAMSLCRPPGCTIDSRAHIETIASPITFPPMPVTLLLGYGTYTGPNNGPAFVIDYRSNGSRIVGSGVTTENGLNAGNGTTILAQNSGDVIQVVSVTGAGIAQGVTLENLVIDGNLTPSLTCPYSTVAATGLTLNAAQNSVFRNLSFQNLGIAIHSVVNDPNAKDNGTQFNIFEHLRGSCVTQMLKVESNNGVQIPPVPISDFTQNVLSDWSFNFGRVSADAAPGIEFSGGDSNSAYQVKCARVAGTGYCLQFDAPGSTNFGGLNNNFYNFHGMLTNNVHAVAGSQGNSIWGYVVSEGQPNPTVDPGAQFSWNSAAGPVARLDSYNLSASIPLSALFMPAPNASWIGGSGLTGPYQGGMYQIVVDLQTTTVGSGTVTATVACVNDNTGLRGLSQTTNPISLATLGSEVSATFTCFSQTGFDMLYHVDESSGGTGQYALRARVIYLQ